MNKSMRAAAIQVNPKSSNPLTQNIQIINNYEINCKIAYFDITSSYNAMVNIFEVHNFLKNYDERMRSQHYLNPYWINKSELIDTIYNSIYLTERLNDR
jgi:hypothetical protein